MNDSIKNVLLAVFVVFVLLTAFNQFDLQPSPEELDYSAFVQKVEDGEVKSVLIDQEVITGELLDDKTFTTIRLPMLDLDLQPLLHKNGVVVKGKKAEQPSIFLQLIMSLLPILIILGIFMFFMRQMQGGGGGKGNPMSFGRSKAKLIPQDQIKTTFADVAGCDEAKEEVSEIVDFLKDPEKFNRLGGRIPKGILMVGPPGTGKTLLAKAIAGEARVPFFTISGSDFVEMFVGVGASRVRDMFAQAKKQSPCIIFIDEIDAVGRKRGGGNFSGGNDEREQTLNQMLVEMDGFGESDGVIVIAATNRADVLDKALLRPGRFDRQVTVGLPDVKGREQILNVHMTKVPLSDDVKSSVLARGTPGFSGADLANLVNEAALFAARKSSRIVNMEHFEQAKDKIMMGAERRSMVMSEKEKEATAYHEAGHAIVGYLMPEHDSVHKVTIIPRGRALGVTHYLPEADKHSHSKRYIEGRLASAYGGRIAEAMIYGDDGVSTGAQSDIQYATQTARAMVTRWGYSDKLGPLLFEEEDNGFSTRQSFSSDTGRIIDEEVRLIADKAYSTAEDVLETHRDKLEAMKDALMKYETIDANQVKQLMEGEEPSEPEGWSDDSSGGDAGGTPVVKTDVDVTSEGVPNIEPTTATFDTPVEGVNKPANES